MNAPEFAYERFNEPPDAVSQAIDAGLESHNFAVAPIGDVRPLAVTAALPTGEIVGGAMGRSWGACCELLQLWVHPDHRRAGTATRLLQEFEEMGASRGCHTFYLTTLSYQAPEFYRKRGYAALAEISGYPDGIIKYLMHKRVDSCVERAGA